MMGVTIRMDDPWGTNCQSTIRYHTEEFEDNFVAKGQLPDSKQYLEILERKLAKLKSQSANAKNILKTLAQTKESHLERIIDSGEAIVINDPDLDQPIVSSSLQRFIAPEKQANTIAELYELLKYDQLGQLFETLNKEKEEEDLR